jgi:hypothetical protein
MASLKHTWTFSKQILYKVGNSVTSPFFFIKHSNRWSYCKECLRHDSPRLTGWEVFSSKTYYYYDQTCWASIMQKNTDLHLSDHDTIVYQMQLLHNSSYLYQHYHVDQTQSLLWSVRWKVVTDLWHHETINRTS